MRVDLRFMATQLPQRLRSLHQPCWDNLSNCMLYDLGTGRKRTTNDLIGLSSHVLSTAAHVSPTSDIYKYLRGLLIN